MFACISVGEFGGGEFRGVELGAEEVDREFGGVELGAEDVVQ